MVVNENDAVSPKACRFRPQTPVVVHAVTVCPSLCGEGRRVTAERHPQWSLHRHRSGTSSAMPSSPEGHAHKRSVSAHLQVLAYVQDLGLCVRMPTTDCPLATMPRLPGLLSGLPPPVASCILMVNIIDARSGKRFSLSLSLSLSLSKLFFDSACLRRSAFQHAH